jgi:hypothetical protein
MTSHYFGSIQRIRFSLYIAMASLLSACGGGDSSTSAALPTNAITFTTFNNPVASSSSYFTSLTGIRGVTNSSDVYITGATIVGSTYTAQLYKGPLTGGGTYYTMSYPSSVGATIMTTNSYSADNLPNGRVNVVGSYNTTQNTNQQGYIYTGAVIDNPTSGFQTINFPGAIITIPHSVMNDLVVGGYEPQTGRPHAFIYQISTGLFTPLTVMTDRNVAETAYGVWHNGGTSYTIVGGYTEASDIEKAYILDYDSSTGVITNTTAYTFNNQPSVLTHFEGITTNGNGGYYLAGFGQTTSGGTAVGALVNITRTPNGFTSSPIWVTVAFPGATTQDSNTVYKNNLLGTYSPGPLSLNGYVANVPISLIK